jgi:hypothetical protein
VQPNFSVKFCGTFCIQGSVATSVWILLLCREFCVCSFCSLTSNLNPLCFLNSFYIVSYYLHLFFLFWFSFVYCVVPRSITVSLWQISVHRLCSLH